MPPNRTLTQEEREAAARHLYHHVDCKHLKGLSITLTREGQRIKQLFAMLGLSSKETIRTGMQAVDASPFKTIFVVEEQSGEVLFALSKNEEYVEAVKRKRPGPGNPPDFPTTSFCCDECKRKGGYACSNIGGGCICWGAQREGSIDVTLDDELETLAK